MVDFKLYRQQQACIDRLNLRIGRMSLADYEAARKSINEAKDEASLRAIERGLDLGVKW